MANFQIKQYFSGVAWSFAFKAGGILATLWVNMLLTRLLPPDEVGVYFLLFSLSMFLSLIARFGLKQTVVKIVAEHSQGYNPSIISGILRKILWVTSVCVLVTCMGLYIWFSKWIALLFDNHPITPYMDLMVLWVAALAFLAPISESFRGLQKYNWSAALDNSITVIFMSFILFGALIIYQTIDLRTVIKIAVLTYGAVATIGFLRLFSEYAWIPTVPSVPVKYILSISTPVFFINIFQYLVANSSLWVVGYFLTATDLAVYGIVIRLYNLIAFPLIITNMAIDPMIAKLHNAREKEKLQSLLYFSSKIAFGVTFIISVALLIMGEHILTLLFGKEYGTGHNILSILIIGNLINVWTGSCNNYLLMTFGQKTMLLITLVWGGVGITLSIMLAPRYGLCGVSWAVATSVALQNITSWLVVYQKTGIKTNPPFTIYFSKINKQKGGL